MMLANLFENDLTETQIVQNFIDAGPSYSNSNGLNSDEEWYKSICSDLHWHNALPLVEKMRRELFLVFV